MSPRTLPFYFTHFQVDITHAFFWLTLIVSELCSLQLHATMPAFHLTSVFCFQVHGPRQPLPHPRVHRACGRSLRLPGQIHSKYAALSPKVTDMTWQQLLTLPPSVWSTELAIVVSCCYWTGRASLHARRQSVSRGGRRDYRLSFFDLRKQIRAIVLWGKQGHKTIDDHACRRQRSSK